MICERASASVAVRVRNWEGLGMDGRTIENPLKQAVKEFQGSGVDQWICPDLPLIYPWCQCPVTCSCGQDTGSEC